MKNHIIWTCLLFLMTSCDSVFVMSGQVLDGSNKPIEHVKINTSEKVITYSDSLGYFEISRFGPGSHSDKLEILASKEGYETIYFDLSQLKDVRNISLKMNVSNQTQITHYPESFVKLFYYINLIFINPVILFTLLFILIKGDKYKWIWILLILSLNVTLKINYVNGLLDLDVFHFPFHIKHYLYYPFTIKVAFPIVIFIFWIIFIFKKRICIQINLH